MKKLLSVLSLAALACGLNGCMIWEGCDESCYDDDYGYNGDFHVDIHNHYGSSDNDCGSDQMSCPCDNNDVNNNDVNNSNIGNDLPRPVINPSDVECVWNSDCGIGYVCKDGVCEVEAIVPECSVNADCADDELCTEGRCIPCQTNQCDTSIEIECVFATQCESGICLNGVCLAPGQCVNDAQCDEGQMCQDFTCVARPECLSDAECGEGRICNASGECEDDVECRKDADCGDNKICVYNMCAECRLDCECAEGNICLNGACVANR